MAVKIRLARRGAKKKPFYRIVASDIESPRDGRFLEILGTYDPMQDPAVVNLDTDKLAGWMKKGAKPTGTVKTLINKYQAAPVESA